MQHIAYLNIYLLKFRKKRKEATRKVELAKAKEKWANLPEDIKDIDRFNR